MSIIIETCPKCGAELQNIVIDTFPPIPKKQCYRCGWSWTGKPEKIVYKPFEPADEPKEVQNCKLY